MLKESLERNLEFSMKLWKKLDVKKGDQVAKIAGFNNSVGGKRKQINKEEVFI